MDSENICNQVQMNQKPLFSEKEVPIKGVSIKELGRDCVKRSAENSPDIENKKRLVFCDITNAGNNKCSIKPQIVKAKKETKPVKADTSSTIIENEENSNVPVPSDTTLHVECDAESTLYTSALDKSIPEDYSVIELPKKYLITLKSVPSDVEDFDKANLKDTFCESRYVPYVFEYYKSKENEFLIEKYMHRQKEVNRGMRAVLVDWMVEVQESFELNHETLYLAVKLVDFYLMRNVISKANLQLVGATAVLLACKYDERMPPLVDDFLYICDDSYTRSELIHMEMKILKTMDFKLGIPISYRFLRRYARCTRASMETLTLARYILETSLMDYDLIDVPDSKVAAAAYYLAIKMKFTSEWTPTFEYYTGYKADELTDLVKRLNRNISVINKNLLTVRTKYLHKIFFEVAKIQPLNLEPKGTLITC